MAIGTHSHDHEHDHAHDHADSGDLRLWLKTAILIGLGLYFVALIVSGGLTNYINNRFSWLSYLAAALFLITGIASAWHLLTAHRRHDHADHDHANHGHEGHTHGTISWGVLAITAVPLVLGTLVPSRPLGAEAVSGGVNVSAAEGAQVQTLSVPPLERNVLDWLRAFNREPDVTAFDGQEVEVVGFIYREPTFDADKFMIARFTVSCCVADANAIGLPVHWADTAALPQGEWVRVRGSLQTGDFRGERLPIVQAQAVEVVAQPDHPYLYP
ncbi:MAG: TIGR03943 family protein [Chloroflexota bacterium]|nr:TIGR03943 family protein [Chloroflexota bacterium]